MNHLEIGQALRLAMTAGEYKSAAFTSPQRGRGQRVDPGAPTHFFTRADAASKTSSNE